MYAELAEWWPLLSPPSHYVEEAADFFGMLPAGVFDAPRPTLLELGCGGGSLAWHLKARFQATLTDVSPGMLAVSRRANPECEHVEGDMRTLRLGRLFDVVLMHDAVMYMTTPADLKAALGTAAVHCRPGGTLVVLPDCVRETFEPDSSTGGEDGPDGRGLRYVEWTWDPDPGDDTAETAYAFLLRSADGRVRAEGDQHRFGLFPRDRWLAWLEEAGFGTRVRTDPWKRDVFLGVRG
jgi:SAM-dependent methyltransferase